VKKSLDKGDRVSNNDALKFIIVTWTSLRRKGQDRKRHSVKDRYESSAIICGIYRKNIYNWPILVKNLTEFWALLLLHCDVKFWIIALNCFNSPPSFRLNIKPVAIMQKERFLRYTRILSNFVMYQSSVLDLPPSLLSQRNKRDVIYYYFIALSVIIRILSRHVREARLYISRVVSLDWILQGTSRQFPTIHEDIIEDTNHGHLYVRQCDVSSQNRPYL